MAEQESLRLRPRVWSAPGSTDRGPEVVEQDVRPRAIWYRLMCEFKGVYSLSAVGRAC